MIVGYPIASYNNSSSDFLIPQPVYLVNNNNTLSTNNYYNPQQQVIFVGGGGITQPSSNNCLPIMYIVEQPSSYMTVQPIPASMLQQQYQQQQQQLLQKQTETPTATTTRPLRCYHCQSFGHKAIHCPSNPAWCGETSGQCTAHGKVRSLSALTRVGGTDQNPVYECIQSSRCQHYMRTKPPRATQNSTTTAHVSPNVALASTNSDNPVVISEPNAEVSLSLLEKCPTSKSESIRLEE